MSIQLIKYNKPMPFITIWSQPAGKPTKNYTKICKTNPILKSRQSPQTLLCKQLTKIFAAFSNPKTNPKRTQTKPISKTAKINVNCLSQKDYEQNIAFFRQKN